MSQSVEGRPPLTLRSDEFAFSAGQSNEAHWACRLMPGGDLLSAAFAVAVAISLLSVALKALKNRRMQENAILRGVFVEAEILARFEAGALTGSERAKARRPFIAPWDSLELELRYVFDGREIVSRGQVSSEAFRRLRSKKTVAIKIIPERPEEWAALA